MRRLLLLLAIPLLLGCIGGDDTSTVSTVTRCTPELTDGVVMNDFAAGVPDAYIGEPVTFTMEVENLGSSVATSIKAELTSLGGFERDGEELVKTVTDLDAYVEGAPAPDIADWELNAPASLGTLESKVSTLRGRLDYNYRSTGQADIVYVPTAEWRQRQKTGETYIETNQECSNGPIAISVQPMNPLRAEPGKDGEINLRFVLTDLGDGVVKSATGDLNVIDTLNVEIPADLEPTSDCDLTGTGTMLTASNLKLIGGEKSLSCRLSFTNKAPLRESQYPIQAIATYGYELEETTDVTVYAEARYMELDTGGDQLATLDTEYGLFSDSGPANPITAANPFKKDGSLYVKAMATHNGDSAVTGFETKSYWTASIRNDDSKTYVLKVDEVAATAAADDGDILYVKLVFKTGEPETDSALFDANCTLTLEVSKEGLSASRTIGGIPVSAT